MTRISTLGCVACLVAISALMVIRGSPADATGGADTRPAGGAKLIAGWPRQSYQVELEPFDSLAGTRQLDAVRVSWSSSYPASATVSGGFSAGSILELDASIITIPHGEYTPATYSRRRADDWVSSTAGHAGETHATLIAEIDGLGARWTGPGVVSRFSGDGPAILHARCAAYGTAFGANGSVSYLSSPVPAMLTVDYEWSVVGVNHVQASERAHVRRVRAVAAGPGDAPNDVMLGLEFRGGPDDDQ